MYDSNPERPVQGPTGPKGKDMAEAASEAVVEVAAMAEAVGRQKTEKTWQMRPWWRPLAAKRPTSQIVKHETVIRCVEYIIIIFDNITSIYYVCFILPFLGLK